MGVSVLPLYGLTLTNQGVGYDITLTGGADALASDDTDTSYADVPVRANSGIAQSRGVGAYDGSTVPEGATILSASVRVSHRATASTSYAVVGTFLGAYGGADGWYFFPFAGSTAWRTDNFSLTLASVPWLTVANLRAGLINGGVANDYNDTTTLRISYVALVIGWSHPDENGALYVATSEGAAHKVCCGAQNLYDDRPYTTEISGETTRAADSPGTYTAAAAGTLETPTAEISPTDEMLVAWRKTNNGSDIDLVWQATTMLVDLEELKSLAGIVGDFTPDYLNFRAFLQSGGGSVVAVTGAEDPDLTGLALSIRRIPSGSYSTSGTYTNWVAGSTALTWTEVFSATEGEYTLAEQTAGLDFTDTTPLDGGRWAAYRVAYNWSMTGTPIPGSDLHEGRVASFEIAVGFPQPGRLFLALGPSDVHAVRCCSDAEPGVPLQVVLGDNGVLPEGPCMVPYPIT